MDKVNNHLYSGMTVYFGTKHGKEKAVIPALNQIGLCCKVVPIDTDQFGTFSGEVERVGSIRDTLRKKIEAVFKEYPEARLALASEGSFGPHPLMPLMRSDHEALLFSDRESKLEIYVEEFSTETNHTEIEFGPRDDLNGFLDKVNFPSHAVMVKTKWSKPLVFKGLQTFHSVGQAILDAFMASPEPVVVLGTDMRACFNPTRMKVIEKAAGKLLERLTSSCPKCQSVGFGPAKSITGLPCEQCGMETHRVRAVMYSCLKCDQTELHPREDGLQTASPASCEFCNP